ncbi:NAD(P)-dependent dehydrogenase (short-subunit alcohol dehydrogenase family) [Mycobacterium frederiksbergense]|uniref:NAD(P)-dependent dehydrogenase (Short-subunit alcohol dehydrogenase family) n=1 Tax=Mycolicibacterium frederiksbergense TaxID=117567 RepID=A0ABT6KW40_9MYCO|nr:SDR family oxidoreductase [Mycolicibacterium frederiksbergense]MDH6194922.1 NAD(P)-dependent dehydrogenase (short-subunit alcohol dehydrogenase family) [Mycolicibacterium frederiksbergense]
MTNNDITGSTAIVTGAGRGLGRGIATALAGAGARVVGVARTGGQLEEVRTELGDAFIAVTADAADPATATRLIDEYRPRTVVLCAGAAPRMSPLTEQTWNSFSENWHVDVAQAFHWIRYALQRPLAPGSTVIAISSGAVLYGSPLSGGYAGAKATVRFIADYAAAESQRAGLGVNVVAVLPQLTPATELGAAAVAAYAEAAGVEPDTFVARRGAVLTPEQAGKSILELATNGDPDHRAYLLRADGLTQLP